MQRAWRKAKGWFGKKGNFGKTRKGIEKSKEISKSNHNIKFKDGSRIDLKGRHPNSKGHFNKKTGEQHGFPHVHDPKAPGGVRKPTADDYIKIQKE